MQANFLSYLLGIVALSFLCSCGAGKKDEIKVDIKDQAPIEQTDKKSEEVAQADVQQAPAGTVVATNALPPEPEPTTTEPEPEPTPVQEKAKEENKA